MIDALEKSEIDCRAALQSNIILCGGSTMFKGFSNRLESELELLTENGSAQMIIKERPYRRYMSWIGAAVLA